MVLHVRCPEHPRYRGIRRPKIDCKRCWEVYNEWRDIADYRRKHHAVPIKKTAKFSEEE